MENLVLLISQYGYLILFPLAVIEGPISTIIAGLFVSMGLLNPFIVYVIMITGDIVGDTLCYSVGRWGGKPFFDTIGPYLGVTDTNKEKAKIYFDVHGKKTIVLSKIIHGIGITGLFVAGSLRISYKKYITTCFLITLVQAALFLSIGILFGRAYIQLNKYLNYFSSTTIIISAFIVVFIVISKRFKIKIKP